MKKEMVFLFVLAVGVSFLVSLGCGTSPAREVRIPLPNESGLTTCMKGEHKLRKLLEREERSADISGYYFLVVGGFSGKVDSATVVRFAWQMNDGTYAFSSLPLEAIRLRLKKDVETPTIEFTWEDTSMPHRGGNGWADYYSDYSDGCNDCRQYLRSQYEPLELISTVQHAVVTIKESDWPIQIKPPGNN